MSEVRAVLWTMVPPLSQVISPRDGSIHDVLVVDVVHRLAVTRDVEGDVTVRSVDPLTRVPVVIPDESDAIANLAQVFTIDSIERI